MLEDILRKFREEILEGRRAFSEQYLQELVGAIAQLQGDTPIKRNLLLNLLESYVNEAKTVSVQEVREGYGVRVLHALPTDKGIEDRQELMNQSRFVPERGSSLEDYYACICENDPMLGCFSIGRRFHSEELFGAFGISLETGRIYDAAPYDLGSKAYEGLRFSSKDDRLNDPVFNLPIDERVRLALRSTVRNHNELIVGDYEIGELWYIDGSNINRSFFIYDENLDRIMKLSESLGIPIVKLNPN
jgi:hypothetical protein